jgi:hypothetical protein
MLGHAMYKEEAVQVLDIIITRNGNIVLINYGGPLWVDRNELLELQLYKKEA